jgi:hypothetical protein
MNQPVTFVADQQPSTPYGIVPICPLWQTSALRLLNQAAVVLALFPRIGAVAGGAAGGAPIIGTAVPSSELRAPCAAHHLVDCCSAPLASIPTAAANRHRMALRSRVGAPLESSANPRRTTEQIRQEISQLQARLRELR